MTRTAIAPPSISRVFLRKPTEEDIPRLLAANRESRQLHHPWVAPPSTEPECREYVVRSRAEDFEGLLICTRDEQAIAGVANLSQIFYRAFQNAYLGFYTYAGFARRGLMTEGLGLVIDHAFQALGLHRVEANIQPGNEASIRLVRRLGFVREGFSLRYLKIDGDWRDHERWALLAEDWRSCGFRAAGAEPLPAESSPGQEVLNRPLRRDAELRARTLVKHTNNQE